jgi:hypothetical protein
MGSWREAGLWPGPIPESKSGIQKEARTGQVAGVKTVFNQTHSERRIERPAAAAPPKRFTIAVASGAQPAAVAPGGTATFPLSLGTVNGFTGSLVMSAPACLLGRRLPSRLRMWCGVGRMPGTRRCPS